MRSRRAHIEARTTQFGPIASYRIRSVLSSRAFVCSSKISTSDGSKMFKGPVCAPLPAPLVLLPKVRPRLTREEAKRCSPRASPGETPLAASNSASSLQLPLYVRVISVRLALL